MGISDSAFSIFYTIYDLGDGCLQKDICYEFFANKQTVNSSIRKLVQEGYIYLKQGVGRDKHIFLTEAGKQFVEKYNGKKSLADNFLRSFVLCSGMQEQKLKIFSNCSVGLRTCCADRNKT